MQQRGPPRALVNAAEKKQSAWIIRVQDKEYGPVNLDELREWRDEGRLIRENEVRAPGSRHWFRAAELVELFGDEIDAPNEQFVSVAPPSLGQILVRSWHIYLRGFWQFLGLTALVVVPSICAQLSSAAVPQTANTVVDFRAALAGLFNFGMLVLSLCAWPIYIAALQLLVREMVQGRAASLREIIPQSFRFWTRIVSLCVLVYGAFSLLMVLALGILMMIAVGGNSLAIVLLALVLLIFQVWMFGRVFINVLFWQQAAVIEDEGALGSLRRSKELARSRRELSWSQRPSVRGALVASLWCAFAMALTIGPQWSAIADYYRAIATIHDPQEILQSLNAMAKPAGFLLPLALGVIEAILRPLLGIAFVLLYFEIKPPSSQPNE